MLTPSFTNSPFFVKHFRDPLLLTLLTGRSLKKSCGITAREQLPWLSLDGVFHVTMATRFDW